MERKGKDLFMSILVQLHGWNATQANIIIGEDKGWEWDGIGYHPRTVYSFPFCISQDSLISNMNCFWCIVIFEWTGWDGIPLWGMHQNLGQVKFIIWKNALYLPVLNDCLNLTSPFLSLCSPLWKFILEWVKGVQGEEYVRITKDSNYNLHISVHNSYKKF